jgi:outer membrane protein assembly factor BamA
LRELYEDYGYINFAAVPTLQLDKDRGTVVTINIDEGQQFTFGKLFFEGQEPWAGEADALRKAGRLCQVSDTICHSCVGGSFKTRPSCPTTGNNLGKWNSI